MGTLVLAPDRIWSASSDIFYLIGDHGLFNCSDLSDSIKIQFKYAVVFAYIDAQQFSLAEARQLEEIIYAVIDHVYARTDGISKYEMGVLKFLQERMDLLQDHIRSLEFI